MSLYCDEKEKLKIKFFFFIFDLRAVLNNHTSKKQKKLMNETFLLNLLILFYIDRWKALLFWSYCKN